MVRTPKRLFAVYIVLALVALLAGGASYAPAVRAAAALSGPNVVGVTPFDSTALVRYSGVVGATGFRVTLIRLSDNGIMEQATVPASQLAFDAQGIWPGHSYMVAVEAKDASGAFSAPTLSAPFSSAPLSRTTYNGFLDTENTAAGQVDTNLWDVRLGVGASPDQGGTFVNGQMHYHLQVGAPGDAQMLDSMRARTPFDFSGGRTLHVHGEVDLKATFENWFSAVLSQQAIGADQLVDLQDRPLAARATPQIELFDNQDGLHLLEALPSGAYEIGTPFKGGYHTSNVRDDVVWNVSATHVQVLIDGVVAFDANWPVALPFTTGYLSLVAEKYPNNGGGAIAPNPCDDTMAPCNVWHLDSWGFDAASTVKQPATAVYYTAKCGPYPSRESQAVTFVACGQLDNSGGAYGFMSVFGPTASTTFTLPANFTAASAQTAGVAFDIQNLFSASRMSVSLNGSPFHAIGYGASRPYSWQAYRVALDATLLKPGVNTVTFRDSVAGAYDTPQVANLQLEVQSATDAYAPPMLPPEPAPIGTWMGGGSPPPPTPTPTPTPSPTPSPTPTPVTISGAACVVTLNAVQQSGTCSGTFTPTK